MASVKYRLNVNSSAFWDYKDYRADPSQAAKTMTLAAGEFIRRFLLHVLPTGFHRIRYYGFLGARHRRDKLARCRQLVGSSPVVSAPPDRPPADVTPMTDYRDRAEALTLHRVVSGNALLTSVAPALVRFDELVRASK
jgi:hypothetical protein